MRPLDAADLVVIAGRALGIGTSAALAQLDVTAAEAALAKAGTARQKLSTAGAAGGPDRAAAAAACIRLVHALLSHRAFPRDGERVAVAAGLQFLALNGWQADLEPPAIAAVVVEALASGQLAPDAAAAWLGPRLTPARQAGLTPVHVLRRTGRAPRRQSARRGQVRRLVATAVLTVTITGVGILAAACSRAPAGPPAPASGVPAVGPVCAHSHGVESPPHRSADTAAGSYDPLRC